MENIELLDYLVFAFASQSPETTPNRYGVAQAPLHPICSPPKGVCWMCVLLLVLAGLALALLAVYSEDSIGSRIGFLRFGS